MQVETLIERSCSTIGEGPHWDERTQQLLYVDINDGSVHRWTAATGKDESHKFDSYCSLVVPCRKGGYLVSVGRSICHWDWDAGKLTTIATVDEGKDTRINDGKCDASGRLWFGTMGLEKKAAVVEKHQGALYSLELDGSVRKHKDGVTISNGLAWTDDNRTMYYIDSIPRKVWAYDFDLTTGTMINERAIISFGAEDSDENFRSHGFPDGMTIDMDGNLWVAGFFSSSVMKFDPFTGNELARVNLPAARVTSCCFGGKTFNELFITCSAFDLSDEEKEKTPLAGSVFRATDLVCRGKPASMYEG